MNDTFMKTKPVFPLLVSMALPNVISMLVNSLYNIIDSRYLSGKPLILTTNMTLKEMQESEDIRYRRIYDRIFEMCFPVRFAGRSWREKAAFKRFDAMKNLMEE